MNTHTMSERKRETHYMKHRSFSLLTALLFTLLLPLISTFSHAQEPVIAQKLVEDLRAKVAADSLNAQLRFELGNALHDAEEKEKAFLHYDKAVSIKPDFLEALVNRGAVLNELGRINEAMASFKQALSVNPRDPKALLNLGNSLYALKRYGEAMRHYELAVESDSTFVEARYYIGIAFADAGIYREAIREWQEILTIAPGSEVARNAKDNIQVLMKFLSAK